MNITTRFFLMRAPGWVPAPVFYELPKPLLGSEAGHHDEKVPDSYCTN